MAVSDPSVASRYPRMPGKIHHKACMSSGRTGYPECAAGGKRLLQHGMPRMQEKIAGRGVPQVCGGDAIRGQSMHRRARRSVGGWMPRIVPPLLDRAEAGSAGRGDASPQMTAQTL